ncbi:MAG: hypothetical protein K9H58_18950 [Bacteroidales bacterium]|nr:hypothetical protein [Bacteroidales bacterium]
MMTSKLSLSVSGNLHNQGNWNAWALNLTGTVDQDIYLDNPVSINQIIKSITGSKLIARTNLLLQNTSLNLMNDSLVFMEGNTLHLKNSSIQNLILRNINPGNNDPLNIIGENNATLIKAKILSDTIIIAGQVLIGNGPVIVQGTLINEGLIQNSGTNYFTLEVFGNLINEEIIKDNPSGFGLDLSLSGDFIQNGTIENRNTILAGATTQYLLLHKEFGGKFLLDNDPISGLQIDDKIVFNGTGIDLAGANLLLPDYSMLYIKQGYIKNCVVQSNIIDFALLENSWCENITLPEVKIFGDCQVKNDVVFLNNLELKGILQNHSDGDYSISIPGNFYNHGTVQNNINSLSISLEGDLFNNGTINIDELVLTGSYDQVIQLQNENNIDGILKFHTNNSLDFEWFKDGISLLSNPYYSGAQSDTLVFLNAVTDAYMGTYNCLTGSEWSRNIVIDTLSNLYLIDLKVFLQGPYNNGYMSNVLITSEQLPLTQPYNQYPWYFPGNENVSAVPNNDIVDWLFLKLKDSDQSGSANKSKVFDKIAVFVLNDGRVVGMDGISLIPFYRNITDSLYIEITHRNHLSIMSAYGLTLEEGIYSYDFSIDSLSAYGGLPSLSKLNTFPPFQYGMVSGDANNDGKVDVTDYESFWKPYAGSKVFYETKDLNFDGHINNQDKNDAWIKNNGKSSQVPQ